MGVSERAEVQDAAPHAELPEPLHRGHPLVADLDQVFGQFVRGDLVAHLRLLDRQLEQVR